MAPLKTLVLATATSFALFGCSFSGAGSSGKSVTMADAFDLDIFGPHEDDLHSPYVSGARFGISVLATGNQQGWTLSSSDPNVMRVTSSLVGGTATVTAGSPGHATLSVLDSTGALLDSHAVTVEVPDQVSLYAEGLLLTGAPDSTAQVSHASIVAGGEATFLVRYFAQGVELYGSGALQPTGTGGVTATTVSASFASDRDFLQVTAPAKGASASVSLAVNHLVVGEVPITSVDASAVTQVSVMQQSSDAATTGTSLALYAHATDATSAEVYGASFDWSINGVSQSSVLVGGPADLFFYSFDPTTIETVTAAYEGFAPSSVVHGHGGYVGSTANVGCALARAPGVDGASSAAAFGLALAGLASARRRRGGTGRRTARAAGAPIC